MDKFLSGARLPKTTFTQKFEKAVNFFDHCYHMQKSTYKGLSEFFKDHGKIEKVYASELRALTKNIWSDMPELKKQEQSLIRVIKEVLENIEAQSRHHFSLMEKLNEIAGFYNSEYFTCKRNKANRMNLFKHKTEQQYLELREREKDRNVINCREKEILKNFHDQLHKLAEEEHERNHKIKEESIIYSNDLSRLYQNELRRIDQSKAKLARQEFNSSDRIAKMAEELRVAHNDYGGEQIEARPDQMKYSIKKARESLSASVLLQQRASKVSQSKKYLQEIVSEFEQIPTQITIVCANESNDHALFDSRFFLEKQRRKMSRELNGGYMRRIAYDMISCYANGHETDPQIPQLLQVVKAKLRTASEAGECTATNLREFWQGSCQKGYLYRWHVRLIQLLSSIYKKGESTEQYAELSQHFRTRVKHQDFEIQHNIKLGCFMSVALINMLLEVVFSLSEGETLLQPDFLELLVLVSKFGEGFLNVRRNVTILLFLIKFSRLQTLNQNSASEPLEAILYDPYLQKIKTMPLKSSGFSEQTEHSDAEHSDAEHARSDQLINEWVGNLINKTTEKFLEFYDYPVPFVNYMKVLMIVENLLLAEETYVSREYIYSALRGAGFNYFKRLGSEITQEWGLSDEKRLQKLVETLEELDFEGVMANYFVPASAEVSKLFGVCVEVAQCKLLEEFAYTSLEITRKSLCVIGNQQSVDLEGFTLRLGVVLARIDLNSPQPLSHYDSYFQVLNKYLSATERNYDAMLQQSRGSELWITKQNECATTNCIDFCSLLYKPFEFLLISLRELETNGKRTEFVTEYIKFIKQKLNNILKSQISKYVTFLEDSLENYPADPPQFALKPKRREKLRVLTLEQTHKQVCAFEEITKRLFNLLFLKDNLEEIIEDFLDPQLYREMGNSIFNLNCLKRVTTENPSHRSLLQDILKIVQVVLNYEERIIIKIANITVYHFLSPLFDNLYFQEEKNAVSEFFASKADYKLSEHTFLRMQDEFEGWLTAMAKNLPSEFVDPFSHHFCTAFFCAVRAQILNSNKFKLPLQNEKIVAYLEKDTGFMSKVLEIKFSDKQAVNNNFTVAVRKLINDLSSKTSTLIAMYEQASQTNNQSEKLYVLVLLNLRERDQSAQEFVKLYHRK